MELIGIDGVIITCISYTPSNQDVTKRENVDVKANL